MTDEERPFPDHPAWQMICPMSGETHATCALADTSDEHIKWHFDRMVDIGLIIPTGGADDQEQVHYVTKPDWMITFEKIIGEYENLDDKEGGQLQHKKCKHVITHAFLNRENIELMALHVDNCDGE